jgi:hypothetical protein
MSIRQLIGIICGAVIGIPFGMFLNLTQPWVRDWYFVGLGALTGAVVGGTVTKRQNDGFAWLLAVLTISGAFAGGTVQHMKWNRSLEGACAGFVLAVAVLLLRSAWVWLWQRNPSTQS